MPRQFFTGFFYRILVRTGQEHGFGLPVGYGSTVQRNDGIEGKKIELIMISA